MKVSHLPPSQLAALKRYGGEECGPEGLFGRLDLAQEVKEGFLDEVTLG